MDGDPLADLPEGWTVWNAESKGRVILAYRPDRFEGDQFPAACLPTLYVSQSSPDQPPQHATAPGQKWYVTLYLEPEVRVHDRETTAPTRRDALAAAREIAQEFADGDIPVREAYQIPREAYLDELDRLTSRE